MISSIQGDIPLTNFFIYKNKEYHINLDLFKIFSKKIQKSHLLTETNEEIHLFNLLDEYIDVSKESVTDFVNFCQFSNIDITKQNILPLLKLAKAFEVQSLIDKIQKFLSENQEDFIIESLFLNLNSNTEYFEEIISNKLENYIKNEHLLDLQLPVIYRVLDKYLLKNQNKQNPPEIIEFLFKCLDKYKRQASVLFKNVSLGSQQSIFINRLIIDYSDIFDFHFLNDSYHKTIYDMQNEVLKGNLINQQQNNEYFHKVQKDLKNLSLKVCKLESENQKLKKEKDFQIEKLTNDFNSQLKKLKDEVKKLTEIVAHQKQMIDDFRSEKTNQKTIKSIKNTNKSINIEYDGNTSHALSGIIDHLMKKSGRNVSDKEIVNVTSTEINQFDRDCIARNAVDIHNSKNYFQTSSEQNAWLMYDFIDRKVHPTHYSIQTRHMHDCCHPRSWVIEGSNNVSDNDWKILDNRQNDESLNGLSAIRIFDIQEYEGKYRYLRIRQTGVNSSNSLHLTIGSLEYFGILFES